jgi:hypothetical protein
MPDAPAGSEAWLHCPEFAALPLKQSFDQSAYNLDKRSQHQACYKV